MSTLYEKYKDDDGFLYVKFSGENTFGDLPGNHARFSDNVLTMGVGVLLCRFLCCSFI